MLLKVGGVILNTWKVFLLLQLLSPRPPPLPRPCRVTSKSYYYLLSYIPTIAIVLGEAYTLFVYYDLRLITIIN